MITTAAGKTNLLVLQNNTCNRTFFKGAYLKSLAARCSMSMNHTVSTLDVGDDYVAKSDGKLCIVFNIILYTSNDHVKWIIFWHVWQHYNLFDYPLSSTLINIYKVRWPMDVLKVMNSNDTLHKCVRLPLSNVAFVVFFNTAHFTVFV